MEEYNEVERQQSTASASASDAGHTTASASTSTDADVAESPVHPTSTSNGANGSTHPFAMSRNASFSGSLNGSFNGSFTGFAGGAGSGGGGGGRGTSTGRNTPNGFPLFNRNGDGVGVGGKLTVLDISPLLAESIRRTHNGESISLLFGDWAERAGMAGY